MSSFLTLPSKKKIFGKGKKMEGEFFLDIFFFLAVDSHMGGNIFKLHILI